MKIFCSRSRNLGSASLIWAMRTCRICSCANTRRSRSVFSTSMNVSSLSLRFVAQAELHADLVMADRAVDDMALDLRHLEPFEVPQRLCRRLDAVLHGILDAGLRRADDFGNAVDMFTHLSVSLRGSLLVRP